MSGARRHCPVAVTDTERDMSRELNTAGKQHGIRLQQVPHHIGHIHKHHPEQETITHSKTPAGPWEPSPPPRSCLQAQQEWKFPPRTLTQAWEHFSLAPWAGGAQF